MSTFYSKEEKDQLTSSFWKLNTDVLDLPHSTKITSKDLYYFEKTTAVANTSKHFQFRIGSIITSNNKIISKRCNQMKTSPIQNYYNGLVLKKNPDSIKRISSCIHAEMAAIQAAKKHPSFDPHNSTIYISRLLRRDSTLASSFPCRSCFLAIKDIGIDRIVCYDDLGRIISIEDFIDII